MGPSSVACPGQTHCLLPDSLSALRALEKLCKTGETKLEFIQHLHDLLVQLHSAIHLPAPYALNHSKVIIQWVPAHVGIDGNEWADDLAKEAAEGPQPSQPFTLKQKLRQFLREQRRKWKLRFEESAHALCYKNLCANRPKDDPIERLPRDE